MPPCASWPCFCAAATSSSRFFLRIVVPHWLAVKAAAEAVAIEPFREIGYLKLMRAHAADGNRAESLRVYHRCRSMLAEELGVDPSPETEAVYLHLLRLA